MGMFLRRGLAGRIALNITETRTTGLSKTQGYVTVGGTKYFSSTTLELTRGSVVEIYVGSTNSTYAKRSYIKIDGKTVQTGSGTYRYVVRRPSTLLFTRLAVSSGNSTYYYRVCDITRT